MLKNELDAYLKPRGVLFGPDPSSNPSLGGMASTGGSGMSTLKYGTSKENVRSMTVVTPQGRVLRTRRATRKSSTGYELNALYMGAEGTLGVITELVVRTFPRPKKRVGAVVTFADVRSATSAVVEATQRANLETLLRCELLNDEGDLMVLRPLIASAEEDIAKFSAAMAFPIIPCDLCGSQDGLQRNAMKAMLEDIERRMPGRKDTMIRALGHVRPSHLLDRTLFDFAALGSS